MYARLRSTGGTSRLDFARSKDAISTCVRQFSTTSLDAAPPNDGNASADQPPSNRRDRSRAAATEINNLLRTASGKPPVANLANRSDAGARPNVVDVKSVPRGLGQGFRGRGGFRGGFRGGLRGGIRVGAAEGAIARPPPGFGDRARSPSRFGRGRGRGAGAGAGGRGAGGRGRGGRGGSDVRRGRRTEEEGEEGEGRAGRQTDKDFEVELERLAEPKTVQDIELDKQYRHGPAVPFNPKLTLESLTGYGPAIAADGARAKSESVLQGLRTLGGGAKHNPEPVHWGVPRTTVKALKHQDGVYFFADAAERAHLTSDAVAAARLPDGKIPGPDDTVKRAVVDAVVRGVYEAPGPGVAGYHARNETWNASANERFEAKVASLVAGRDAGAQKVKAKAKKA